MGRFLDFGFDARLLADWLGHAAAAPREAQPPLPYLAVSQRRRVSDELGRAAGVPQPVPGYPEPQLPRV